MAQQQNNNLGRYGSLVPTSNKMPVGTNSVVEKPQEDIGRYSSLVPKENIQGGSDMARTQENFGRYLDLIPAPEKLPEPKKSILTKGADTIKKGVFNLFDWLGKQRKKQEETALFSKELLLGKTKTVRDENGKLKLESQKINEYKQAKTPEEKNVILDQYNQETPLLKALNSETGKKITGQIYEKTSNLPLKLMARVKSIGDKTYDEAYSALLEKSKDPKNPRWKQILYGVQDSGVQSAIGALLSVGTAYLTKRPSVGKAVGTAYFGSVSAEAQRKEKGSVTSIGNIAIDTIGDQIISGVAESALKSFAKEGAKKTFKEISKKVLSGGLVEGVTEPTQSFLKFGNDYINAKSSQQKKDVVDQLTAYVKNGGLINEFFVGGLSGMGITGIASLTGKMIGNKGDQNVATEDTIKQQKLDVAKVVNDHIVTAIEAKDTLSQSQLNELGGDKALIESTKKDIVDGLKAYGLDEQASSIENIDIKNIDTLNEFKNEAINTITNETSQIAIEPNLIPKTGQYEPEQEKTAQAPKSDELGVYAPLVEKAKNENFDERLAPLVDENNMVTVYRASNEFPEILKKDTYVSTKPDNVRYYAESWYKGDPKDIKIESFKIPASKLKRGGSPQNWQLTEDFKWKTDNQLNGEVTEKDLTVYRGEGKGIGNSTLVKGQYFADSKEFASEFGNVTEYTIPKGSKIFDLDTVKDGNGAIPQEMLVDQDRLTDYLIKQGFDYTKNTNTRGVEYVKLNKQLNSLENLAKNIKRDGGDFAEFKKKVMSNYDKFREEIARQTKDYTPAQIARLSDPLETIWNNVKQPESKATETAQETINTDVVANLEDEIVSIYQTKENADEKLSEILTRLELAEKGERIMIPKEDGGYEFTAKKSTFPSWIPDNLRSRKSIDSLLSQIYTIESISYPFDKRAVAQRDFIDALLDVLDDELGVDTSDQRAKIREFYDQGKNYRAPKRYVRKSITGKTTEYDAEQTANELLGQFSKSRSPRSKGGLANVSDIDNMKSINKMIDKNAEKPADQAEEIPKDFKISERAKSILESFGIPVQEKNLSRRLLGVFKHQTKGVRVQSLYDVTTVTHEAIHAIDNKLNFSEKLINETGRGADIRKQLTDIYEDLYPTAKRTHPLDTRIKEGLAVLFENYFYDPTTISQKYPDLVKEFIKPTGKYYNPLFSKLLDDMNSLVEDYSKLLPEQRIASRIRTGKEIIDEDTGFSFKQRMEFEIFNRFEPLKRYAKDANVTGTWDDPTVQAFNILNKNTIIYNWVKGEVTPVLLRDGNFKIEKGSVESYLKLVKGKEKEFRTFLIARRVLEDNNHLNELKNEYQKLGGDEALSGADVESDIYILNNEIQKVSKMIAKDDFSTQDATHVVVKFKDQFSEAVKIYDQINERLIDFSYENGMLDKETADTYKKQKGYTSFRRFIDDNLNSVGTIKQSSKSKVSSFKERTGSNLDIIDPIDSQILAINEVVGKSLENTLWAKVAKLANTNYEIARRFERIESMPAIDGQGNISFPQEKDPNIIRVWVAGKRQFYKSSQEFLAVMKTLRGKEKDAFAKILRTPASVFTRLTTSANPMFAMGNLTVDQFSALTQTKTGFKPVKDPIESLIDYIKSDDGIKAYFAVGGKRQTLSSYYDLSPDEIVSKLTGGDTKLDKTIGVIDSSLGILEMPSNTSEIITRFSEYRRAISKGNSMSEAMYKASEVTTPFQLSGNYGGRIGQEVIRSIPYLNAIFQVLYKFGRTTKENPARVANVFGSLLIAGISSAITLMKYSSDEQKRLLSEQPARNLGRYLYLPALNGKDLFRIRIPEQFGAFTGISYLYTIEKYGGNKAVFDDYLDSISVAVPEQINIFDFKKMALSYIPQVIKPTILVSANTKVFPEIAPIVPQYVADQAPKYQYNAYTSDLAKTLGNLFNASPMMVDFWIKNQFGAIGNMILGNLPSNPIYIQEQEFVMSGRSYSRFYDNRTIVKQQFDEITKINPKQYTYDEKSNIKSTKKVYDAVSDILSDVRKINQDHDIPSNIKDGVYKLLLKIDSTNNILDTRNDISQLRSLVNAEKFKLKIN